MNEELKVDVEIGGNDDMGFGASLSVPEVS
jgi:hypothetical protein